METLALAGGLHPGHEPGGSPDLHIHGLGNSFLEYGPADDRLEACTAYQVDDSGMVSRGQAVMAMWMGDCNFEAQCGSIVSRKAFFEVSHSSQS